MFLDYLWINFAWWNTLELWMIIYLAFTGDLSFGEYDNKKETDPTESSMEKQIIEKVASTVGLIAKEE